MYQASEIRCPGLLCRVVADLLGKVVNMGIDLSDGQCVRRKVFELSGVQVATLACFGVLEQGFCVSQLLHDPTAATKPLLVSDLNGKLMSKDDRVNRQKNKKYYEAGNDPETFVDCSHGRSQAP